MMTNFEKSDYIVYDNAGVCLIEDITAKKFDYWNSERLCYVLRPIGNPGSFVYVPVDNEKLTGKMRRIMSKEEIDALLDNVRTQYIIWPDDRRIRMERFKGILSAKNQQDMLMLATCIYAKKKELAGDIKASWGDQMRSYVLHPYQMVKDLRTGYEEGNTSNVLDGGLNAFIDAGIRWRASGRAAEES